MSIPSSTRNLASRVRQSKNWSVEPSRGRTLPIVSRIFFLSTLRVWDSVFDLLGNPSSSIESGTATMSETIGSTECRTRHSVSIDRMRSAKLEESARCVSREPESIAF